MKTATTETPSGAAVAGRPTANGHGRDENSGSVPTGPARLGERLVDNGLITPQQLRQALEYQSRSGGFLGQTLVDLGFMGSAEMGGYLSRQFGIPYVDLLTLRPDPDVLSLVPEHMVRREQILPIRLQGDRLELAMVDPFDVSTIDRVHAGTGKRVIPRLTMAWELQRAINELYDAFARTTEALEQLERETCDTTRDGRGRRELVVASEAPIVRLVDAILESALAQNASDIHFEPHEGGMRVRFRIDGQLADQTEIPRSQMAAVTARLKVLCLMDITESRRPQDGRMRREHHGNEYDFRAATVPTVFGEKLAFRLLHQSQVLMPLNKLGFLPDTQALFENLVRQPHGMVVVVGPTGSGKSTTLYSALNLINDQTRNIMTLEDPVEYNVRGLNQVQVNPRIGLTFASGLRAFVRLDPDVILVGEIRDRETAEMAVQASLTGHLMLSTLHTNSAVGTIARLNNLGVDPFLTAQALLGVVSQRLVARVCPHCAETYRPGLEMLQALGIGEDESRNLACRRGRGCHACHGRGRMGRIGVFEVMVMDEPLRRLVMRGAPESELQAAAEAAGMRSLRNSALAAVRAGLTTPQEMGRIILSARRDAGLVLEEAA